MEPDKPLYPQVLDYVTAMTKRVTDNVVARVGWVGRPVSVEKQLQAYQELTNEDIIALIEKHGMDKVRSYITEMNKRVQRRG